MTPFITVGLLYRRQVRRFLMGQNVKFVEEKGLLDSAFFVECDSEKFRQMTQILDNWKRQIESPKEHKK